MLIKNTNLTLMTSDMDRSISFYLSLGFNLLNRWGNHYAQLTAPGLNLGLHPTLSEHIKGNSGNASIGFTTDNFEAVQAHLDALKISTVSREEEGGSFLHFADPDGTSLYFIQPKW